MTRHLRKVCVPALTVLVLASGLAGCTGGRKAATAERPAPGRVSTGPMRTMGFQLADTSSGPVSADVPSQPIGSTPTTIPGVTLQLYVVKRQDPGAVLVVFALQVDASAVARLLPTGGAVRAALSSNGDSIQPVNSVSGVALLDPAGLKDYETFMIDPSKDPTCLCSLVDPSFPTSNIMPGTRYFAALVAAPPPGVTKVSFVTGLATIGNVTITG